MSRLLIVQQVSDDDEILKRLPGLDDLYVEHVTSAAAALRRLAETPFDAMLLSPASSLEDDLALLEQARAVRPGVRAVLLANVATPDAVIAAMRAQVFAVFTPPFHPDQIADLVRKAADDEEWNSHGIRVLGASPHWISLRVSAHLVSADRLVAFMDQLHRRLFPAATLDLLLMAFREILLNAIEHGAGLDAGKDVRVDAIRTRRALTFYFQDPGPGFVPGALPYVASAGDPISHIERREEAGLRPGGFGLMLSRQLVDEVIYHPLGNEVLLVKHLD